MLLLSRNLYIRSSSAWSRSISVSYANINRKYVEETNTGGGASLKNSFNGMQRHATAYVDLWGMSKYGPKRCFVESRKAME